MALTAYRVENTDGEQSRVDVNERGKAFVENWHVVGTRDTVEAAACPLLPRVGSAYGPAAPRMRVVGITARVLGGDPNRPGVQGGVCLATVSYAEPERMASSRNPAPEGPQSNFTEFTTASGSIPIDWAWPWIGYEETGPDESTPPTIGPLNGISRQTGQLGIKVTAYYRADQLVAALNRATELLTAGALNAEEITLPKFKGSDVELTCQKGQLLYKGMAGPVRRESPAGEVFFELQHELERKEDWLVLHQVEDQSGVPVQSQLAHVQPWKTFGGLW